MNLKSTYPNISPCLKKTSFFRYPIKIHFSILQNNPLLKYLTKAYPLLLIFWNNLINICLVLIL